MSDDSLLYWVREREAIRRKREAGRPAPWTRDPILQTYRFCNVHRADDRVSRWLRANVLSAVTTPMDLPSFILFSALCRWVNWPPTIKLLMDARVFPGTDLTRYSHWPKIGAIIDNAQKQGKAWTGAYMVRAKPGSTKGKGHFVATEVVYGSLYPVIDQLCDAVRTPSMQSVWALLCSRLNWGDFMAGQLVADWSYTPLLEAAEDRNTWAPQGPGSRRGFNRLLGRPLKQRISDEEWLPQLQGWRREVLRMRLFPAKGFSLFDLQNCLCEVDKYLRVVNGEGRPRAKYKPETAF